MTDKERVQKTFNQVLYSINEKGNMLYKMSNGEWHEVKKLTKDRVKFDTDKTDITDTDNTK